jgi:hypothetical protein
MFGLMAPWICKIADQRKIVAAHKVQRGSGGGGHRVSQESGTQQKKPLRLFMRAMPFTELSSRFVAAHANVGAALAGQARAAWDKRVWRTVRSLEFVTASLAVRKASRVIDDAAVFSFAEPFIKLCI